MTGAIVNSPCFLDALHALGPGQLHCIGGKRPGSGVVGVATGEFSADGHSSAVAWNRKLDGPGGGGGIVEPGLMAYPDATA